MRRCYYWAERPNFGDALTLPLLRHFAGGSWVHSSPQDADVVAIGSILEHLPEDWEGIVAGAGKLHEDSVVKLPRATILGVRGLLTRDALGLGNVVVGDPGLLASELVPVERGTIEFSVVPHWTDHELYPKELAKAQKYKYAEPVLIDPSGDPLEVIRQIGASKKIVSSSLHGCVISDAFQIPRRAEPFPKMNNSHEGQGFKFRDHASAIGMDFQFGVLQTANRQNVERCQKDLFDMFRSLSDV